MTDLTATAQRSVSHGVFTIERTYPSVTPRRVFDAFATEAGKDAWFSGPDDRWDIVEREFDFRVGGRESLKGHENRPRRDSIAPTRSATSATTSRTRCARSWRSPSDCTRVRAG